MRVLVGKKEVKVDRYSEEEDLPEITKSNQIKRIVAYLNVHGSISAYEATTKLSIGSPRKRFSDMRRMGYKLDDEWVEGRNKYNEKWRAKKYFLVED
jgi:hypothetical protein